MFSNIQPERPTPHRQFDTHRLTREEFWYAPISEQWVAAIAQTKKKHFLTLFSQVAPTLRMPSEFFMDSEMPAQSMFEVQFSRLGNIPDGENCCRKFVGKLLFLLCNYFQNRVKSRIQRDVETSRFRPHPVIFCALAKV